jgi:hypothetical protein
MIGALICCFRSRRAQSMRWKINHREHDPRYVDLMAVLALLILIVAAYRFFMAAPEVTDAAFIVPSQSMRW